MDRLARVIPVGVAVPVSAAAFGAGHLNALPGGVLGVGLTMCFALAASGMRWLAKGRLGPGIAVHALADVYLLAIVEGLWQT